MYEIDDIADYIITKVKIEDENASLINLKLQKLLYYIQAWSYGIKKAPLFNGKFEAWVHGPVNRHIYDRFVGTKTLYSEITLNDRLKTTFDFKDDDKDFLDYILENYVKFSGTQLEKMTHNEKPWLEARGSIDLFERCENIISEKTMISYYGQRWKEINEE